MPADLKHTSLVFYESMGFTHLDACIAEDLQGGPDISLELVLHPRQAQQLHLHLQALDHSGHLQGAVMNTELGLDISCLGNNAQIETLSVGAFEMKNK